MIDSKTIEKAKEIRHEAALKHGYATKDIDWPYCVGMAMRGEELPWKKATQNEMLGSPKQVSWANDIKGRIVPVLNDLEAAAFKYDAPESQKPMQKMALKAIDKMREEKDSRIWIALESVGKLNRDDIKSMIITMAKRALAGKGMDIVAQGPDEIVRAMNSLI